MRLKQKKKQTQQAGTTAAMGQVAKSSGFAPKGGIDVGGTGVIGGVGGTAGGY